MPSQGMTRENELLAIALIRFTTSCMMNIFKFKRSICSENFSGVSILSLSNADSALLCALFRLSSTFHCSLHRFPLFSAVRPDNHPSQACCGALFTLFIRSNLSFCFHRSAVAWKAANTSLLIAAR